MAGISGTLTAGVVSRLRAFHDGVNPRIGAIEAADRSLKAPGIRSILAHNIAVDLSEKSGLAHYPALLVYCDKLSNSLREKFRECAALVLPADRVDTVAQIVESLDACPDLRSLTAILDPGR